MRTLAGSIERPIRTIFISDAHLGCKHAQAEELLNFLHAFRPEQIYLVGDFIDGWKLKKVWRWNPTYSQILQRLSDLAQRGTRVLYTPGNHDDFLRSDRFLRQVLDQFHFLEVADEFIHETADRRRFLITHGDKFDTIETGAKWVSVVASFAYDSLISTNHLVTRFHRTPRVSRHAFSSAVKRYVKTCVRFVSQFEKRLMQHALINDCDGILCGHIHTPVITEMGGITYCNTGDWVEHATAILEHGDGRLELIDWHRPPVDAALPVPADSEEYEFDFEELPLGPALPGLVAAK